jgi:tagatose 6-phosphate kinase
MNAPSVRSGGAVVCVSLASALQITLVFPSFRTGEVNRARQRLVSQGGKANNCARVLRGLGHDAVLVGFSGGSTGAASDAFLRGCGVVVDTVPVEQPTRMCVTAVDAGAGQHTELVEEAAWPGAAAFDALLDRTARHLAGASALILAGALPPGAPIDAYPRILRLAAGAGIPAFVDTSGDTFRRACHEQPLLLKLNRREQVATGPADAAAFATSVHSFGVPWLLVTDGPRPAVLYGRENTRELHPPAITEVSALGSGDATTAGIVAAWAKGEPMERAVQFGLACGAANARTWIPGELDWTGLDTLP